MNKKSEGEDINSPRASRGRLRVVVFAMPFASQAAVRHAEKLIECIAPSAQELLVIGDNRISVLGNWNVVLGPPIPTLHYIGTRQPLVVSALAWITSLVQIEWRAVREVVRRSGRVDVVVAFLGSYNAPVLWAARRAGARAISFDPATDAALMRIRYGGLVSRLITAGVAIANSAMHRAADVIVTESALLAPVGVSASKLRVANLYVDTHRFAPLTDKTSRPVMIGMIARLVPEKGVPQFLQAIRQLSDLDATFVVIGDGPLAAVVAQAALQLSAGRLRYEGWLAPDALAAELATWRLLVLPSAGEGMPNVVLEAMAAGVTVLATAVGGIPEVIVDAETGYLLNDASADSIEAGIRRTLSTPDVDAVSIRARRMIMSRFSLRAAQRRWHQILSDSQS